MKLKTMFFERKIPKVVVCLFAAALMFGVVYYPTAVSVAGTTRQLPIYCVQRDQKVLSISFDAAWGDARVRQSIESQWIAALFVLPLCYNKLSRRPSQKRAHLFWLYYFASNLQKFIRMVATWARVALLPPRPLLCVNDRVMAAAIPLTSLSSVRHRPVVGAPPRIWLVPRCFWPPRHLTLSMVTFYMSMAVF